MRPVELTASRTTKIDHVLFLQTALSVELKLSQVEQGSDRLKKVNIGASAQVSANCWRDEYQKERQQRRQRMLGKKHLQAPRCIVEGDIGIHKGPVADLIDNAVSNGTSLARISNVFRSGATCHAS